MSHSSNSGFNFRPSPKDLSPVLVSIWTWRPRRQFSSTVWPGESFRSRVVGVAQALACASRSSPPAPRSFLFALASGPPVGVFGVFHSFPEEAFESDEVGAGLEFFDVPSGDDVGTLGSVVGAGGDGEAECGEALNDFASVSRPCIESGSPPCAYGTERCPKSSAQGVVHEVPSEGDDKDPFATMRRAHFRRAEYSRVNFVTKAS